MNQTHMQIAIIEYAFVRIQKRNQKQNDIITVRAKVFASILWNVHRWRHRWWCCSTALYIHVLLLYEVSCVLEFGIECCHGYIPFPSISYFTTKLKPLFQYDWFHIVLQSCLNAIRVFLPRHTTYKSKSQLKHSFDTLNCNVNAMTLWFWLNQSAFPVNTTWSR